MKNNNNFLRQFFKEQNIFQQDAEEVQPEKIEINTQEETDYLKEINTKEFISNKNVNLKALFKTIEEEKEKIKNITKYKTNIKLDTDAKPAINNQSYPEPNKPTLKISSLPTFHTTLKTHTKNTEKTQKSLINKPKPLHTNFKKFTDKTLKIETNTDLSSPQKQEITKINPKNIEDIASFSDIIQSSSTIELRNILGSKSKGRMRLSRIAEKTPMQREYLPDLWEISPEKYSQHDKPDNTDNVDKKHKISIRQKTEEEIQQEKQTIRLQEIEKEQKLYKKKLEKLEKNKKRQELKRKIIKEFNSYSSILSHSVKKTNDFFSNYAKNTKNKISKSYSHFQKSQQLKALKQQELKIARQKEEKIKEIQQKQRLEIKKQNKLKQEKLQKIKTEKQKRELLEKKLLKKQKISNILPKSIFFTEVKEWIKIGGLVAGVFIVGTGILRAPGFISQYENILNPLEFSEQQDSVSNLLTENKNPFQNIESLPVAGIKNNAENLKSNEYLTITPPDRRIIIPKIAKNIPILEVDPLNLENGKFSDFEADVQKMLKDGVVHYPGTAEPGQNGNLFITGHSSYYPWDNGKYKDVFAALHNLEEGDEYFVFDKGKKYKYVITTRKVVSPNDVSVLDQNYEKKTGTLMTCTPVGTAKNRLILQSELVEVGY